MKEHQQLSGTSKSDATTWVILAGLLVLGFLVGLGGIAITDFNQQGQLAAEAQTTPNAR
jgi:hypothetical protein